MAQNSVHTYHAKYKTMNENINDFTFVNDNYLIH